MNNRLANSDATLILIVDDVEANRFVLRNIISDMGCQPVLAENGVQALKLVEKIRPSVILLDVAMPEMDGYEFCQIMKDNPDTRDIPIVFISAFDDPSDVIKGFEIGGEDYITKPFIQEVVQARVGVHLRLYDATRKILETNRQLTTSINEQLKQMQEEKKNVLYALLRVARENARYDEKHMERIQENCKTLALAMQLSPLFESKISDTFVETIELAAPLCDLGNVAIPTEILQKQSVLSDGEIEVMKKHTEVGAKILEDIKKNCTYNEFIDMSIEIVRFHHENWDGTGYPNGVKGDDIPLSAQIVSMVSTFCALTEKRTYRVAFTKEEALQIMEQDATIKFNPAIFEIYKKIVRQLH